MKILLSHQPVVVSGGAERATIDLGAALHNFGHEVFLWGSWNSCPEFVKIAESAGLRILKCDARTRIGEMRSLRKACQKHEIDIVLSHGRRYNALTPFVLFCARTRHIPVLRAHVSTWDEPRSKTLTYRILAPFWNRFWMRVLKSAPRIICISASVALDAQKSLDCKPSRVVVIYDAVGVCGGQVHVVTSERPRSPFRLISVGRLQPVKRFEMVIPLMQELLRYDQDVYAEIAGTGESLGCLDSAIRDAGLASHISLLGHQEDMTKVYARSHVLVHFRTDEGFGRIHVEAQQRGLPVVCSRGGASAEVVSDGHSGFLHDSSDIAGMAQSILRLKRDLQLYTAFSKNACEWSRRFSVESMAEQYEEVFKTVINPVVPQSAAMSAS
jgi:glycosyltransferase involved in cell wall biosynthesis